MSAYACNEGTCVSDIFVIMNFADTSKKRINPNANEKMKIFSSFEQQEFQNDW